MPIMVVPNLHFSVGIHLAGLTQFWEEEIRKPQINARFIPVYAVGFNCRRLHKHIVLLGRPHESLKQDAPLASMILANGLESRWGHQHYVTRVKTVDSERRPSKDRSIYQFSRCSPESLE